MTFGQYTVEHPAFAPRPDVMERMNRIASKIISRELRPSLLTRIRRHIQLRQVAGDRKRRLDERINAKIRLLESRGPFANVKFLATGYGSRCFFVYLPTGSPHLQCAVRFFVADMNVARTVMLDGCTSVEMAIEKIEAAIVKELLKCKN